MKEYRLGDIIDIKHGYAFDGEHIVQEDNGYSLLCNIGRTVKIKYFNDQKPLINAKVIIALNMTDILEKKGLVVHEEVLSRLLNTTVIKISALKNTGVDHLIQHIKDNEILENKGLTIFNSSIEKEISNITSKIDSSKVC